MKVFNLIISTPEDIFFEGDVRSLKAKTSFGEFQMYADHEPYIATVRPCVFTIVDEKGEKLEYAISEGTIETKGDSVVLCVNSIDSKDSINLEKAEEAKARAMERIDSKDYKVETSRAKNALARANARIELGK
ncbi:ATP synthase F1 subunit epsilon [uncultured Clostridium sp.]|jgi:F-type H+-transporting ATPase subunit epsilon|uniref:ATP synthase F1 subunit epsilon n=1 Tax=uncultured Clostridium sp. TaxID=59620 RepID=UPI002613DC51|nr:ATP synthase F1 subunit epsilon [uncultured Clostridium sp.]